MRALRAAGLSSSNPLGGLWVLPTVYFVPISKPFSSRWDAHMGSGLAETREGRGADCTHWCWFPPLWEVLWGRLALALKHDARDCGASSGQGVWAPGSMCHWEQQWKVRRFFRWGRCDSYLLLNIQQQCGS